MCLSSLRELTVSEAFLCLLLFLWCSGYGGRTTSFSMMNPTMDVVTRQLVFSSWTRMSRVLQFMIFGTSPIILNGDSTLNLLPQQRVRLKQFEPFVKASR